MQLGISLPTFAEPDELVSLGVAAELAGWDALLLWDHLVGSRQVVLPIADPWVTLGALAADTRRIRLGTGVTPLARRRPAVVARQAVTLDRLSGGRAILGVGLGNPPADEYGAFGEPTDLRTLASLLDEGLEVVTALWSGERVDHHGVHHTVDGVTFAPRPLQQPRIPIWVAATGDHAGPLRRAARWDGVLLSPVGDDGDVAATTPAQLAAWLDVIRHHRPDDTDQPFDVGVLLPGPLPTGAQRDAYEEAGATWLFATGYLDRLADVIRGGP